MNPQTIYYGAIQLVGACRACTRLPQRINKCTWFCLLPRLLHANHLFSHLKTLCMAWERVKGVELWAVAAAAVRGPSLGISLLVGIWIFMSTYECHAKVRSCIFEINNFWKAYLYLGSRAVPWWRNYRAKPVIDWPSTHASLNWIQMCITCISKGFYNS